MNRKARRSEPLVKQIITATFPDYKGRKIQVSTDFPRDLISYWSGGSVKRFVFYQPDAGKIFEVDTLEAPWIQHKSGRGFNEDALPESVVLVEHRFFCGHDMGITIYVKSPLMLEDQNV
jgi:hypothetical protein